MLADKKYCNGPHRILTDSIGFTDFFLPGEKAVLSNKKIYFSSGAEINLKNAYSWRLKIPKVFKKKVDLTCISNALKGYSFVKPELAENLKLAFIRKDIPAFSRITDSIIGLGPGLTPSGDDILCGFISVFHFLKYERLFDFFLKKVKIKYNKTNFISAQYLKWAVDGEICENVANAIYCTAAGCEDAKYWINHVSGIGATSGKDTLFGILTAMEVYNVIKSGEK